MKRVILVFDDVESLKNEYTERLQKLSILKEHGYEVESLGAKDFQTEMESLKRRHERTRIGKSWPAEFSGLDKTAIFVVDYDLLKSEGFLTGETVAYWSGPLFLRTFSEVLN